MDRSLVVLILLLLLPEVGEAARCGPYPASRPEDDTCLTQIMAGYPGKTWCDIDSIGRQVTDCATETARTRDTSPTTASRRRADSLDRPIDPAPARRRETAQWQPSGAGARAVSNPAAASNFAVTAHALSPLSSPSGATITEAEALAASAEMQAQRTQGQGAAAAAAEAAEAQASIQAQMDALTAKNEELTRRTRSLETALGNAQGSTVMPSYPQEISFGPVNAVNVLPTNSFIAPTFPSPAETGLPSGYALPGFTPQLGYPLGAAVPEAGDASEVEHYLPPAFAAGSN